VFSNYFENLKVVAFKSFHLWSNNGQKFSLKDGAFGTLAFIIKICLE